MVARAAQIAAHASPGLPRHEGKPIVDGRYPRIAAYRLQLTRSAYISAGLYLQVLVLGLISMLQEAELMTW